MQETACLSQDVADRQPWMERCESLTLDSWRQRYLVSGHLLLKQGDEPTPTTLRFSLVVYQDHHEPEDQESRST